MNAIKKLLLATSMLAITSVGFASTVTFGGASPGAFASILVDNGSPANIFTGTGSGIKFYDLQAAFDTNVNFVASATKASLTPPSQLVTINLYQDTGAVGGATAGEFDNPASMTMTPDLLLATSTGFNAAFNWFLSASNFYFLEFITTPESGLSAEVSAVPVPAAGILFASALFGAGFLGRRKKKAKTAVMGAFARAA